MDGMWLSGQIQLLVKISIDMVLTSIKDARLVEIINTNTYSGQRGEWEVHSWKKV